ncbi:MAG: DUF4258 domain-containing protein [Geminicoccaceae bacterium]
MSAAGGEADRWSPAKATDEIRAKAKDPSFQLVWTKHARDQMEERSLIMSDVLHLLKCGFVYEEGSPSTRPGCYKYKMEYVTPNSQGRTVCAVVIPDQSCLVKIVTVMWKDES